MKPADLYFNVSKAYPDFLIDLELTLNNGEFFSLLGPSGCGKTTFLRLIAGLEKASASKIILNGYDVSNLSPANRKIGMVFQDYALFPHLNVTENIKYGLKNQKIPASLIRSRTEEMISLFELEHLVKRDVHQLSGGEKQRVALARALATEPLLLLLDEPFSALDYGMRTRLRTELQIYQRKIGFTCIFVTHQQEEALIVSDRLGVMQNGKLIQCGTPLEIYESPTNHFVAEFVGEANLLLSNLYFDNSSNDYTLEILELGLKIQLQGKCSPGQYYILVRPEDIMIEYDKQIESGNCFKAIITKLEYFGYMQRMELMLNNKKIKVTAFKYQNKQFKIEDEITIAFNFSLPKLISKAK